MNATLILLLQKLDNLSNKCGNMIHTLPFISLGSPAHFSIELHYNQLDEILILILYDHYDCVKISQDVLLITYGMLLREVCFEYLI